MKGSLNKPWKSFIVLFIICIKYILSAKLIVLSTGPL
jgi:hypothetical protein